MVSNILQITCFGVLRQPRWTNKEKWSNCFLNYKLCSTICLFKLYILTIWQQQKPKHLITKNQKILTPEKTKPNFRLTKVSKNKVDTRSVTNAVQDSRKAQTNQNNHKAIMLDCRTCVSDSALLEAGCLIWPEFLPQPGCNQTMFITPELYSTTSQICEELPGHCKKSWPKFIAKVSTKIEDKS